MIVLMTVPTPVNTLVMFLLLIGRRCEAVIYLISKLAAFIFLYVFFCLLFEFVSDWL
jgi:hypothetical protein